jgi:hypothetical protein
VGDGDTEQGGQAGLRGMWSLAVTDLVRRSTESDTDPLRSVGAMRSDPMDGVMFGLIIFLAIAGPTLLALALYWWRNPDRRLSWRRALEESSEADRDQFRRPSWRGGWPFMGGGGSGGGAAATAAAAPAEVRWSLGSTRPGRWSR